MKTRNQLIVFIIYCLSGLIYVCNAQDIECEDVGYEDRPADLRFFNGDNTVRNVPITLHIIRTDDGYTSLQIENVYQSVEDFNNASAYVDLFVCGVNYIDSSEYYSLDDGNEHQALRSEYNNLSTLNAYFAGTVISPFSGNSVCGFAYYPTNNTLNKGVSVIKNSCANSNNGTTTVHEWGHNFDLPHTHSTYERISGSNCHVAGDYFCDTGASPTLSSGMVNSNCEFTQSTLTDLDGIRYIDAESLGYVPLDPRNYMGYGRKSCRSRFSDMQQEEQATTADWYLTGYECQSLGNTEYDLNNKIYPNPFNEFINLPSNKDYKVYDLNGKLLILGYGKTVKTSSLKKGIYLLVVGNEVYKVIK